MKRIKVYLLLFVITLSVVNFVPVYASTWSRRETAGLVYATKSGNKHNTQYKASHHNYSGCATTWGVASEKIDSSCAYRKDTKTDFTWTTNARGHYHLYATFAGMQEVPNVRRVYINYDTAKFKEER